jgi:hypothetical protein
LYGWRSKGRLEIDLPVDRNSMQSIGSIMLRLSNISADSGKMNLNCKTKGRPLYIL